METYPNERKAYKVNLVSDIKTYLPGRDMDLVLGIKSIKNSVSLLGGKLLTSLGNTSGNSLTIGTSSTATLSQPLKKTTS
ncbi:hypothetical protein CR513_51531, partial [Mucuna pruriens]